MKTTDSGTCSVVYELGLSGLHRADECGIRDVEPRRFLEEAVSQVHFAQSPPEPGKRQTPRRCPLSRRESFAHSLFFNDVGLHHHRRGQYGPAAQAFAVAVGYGPDDAVILENYANSSRSSGNTDDALATLTSHPSTVESSDDLLSLQTELFVEAGRTDEAIAGYQRRLDAGRCDENGILELVRLLISAELAEEAEKIAAAKGAADEDAYLGRPGIGNPRGSRQH